MKKTLLTIFVLSLLFNLVKGQDFSIRLLVTDSFDRKDTIEFGLNYSATIGIDSSFGEQDIFGQSWDSLDMRIIQRDSMSHHCLKEWHWPDNSTAPEIYYPINLDLKVDIRPFTGQFGTIYMNFEILIKSANPPITITTDFSGISGNMYEGWSALHLLDTNCNTVETKSIYFSGYNDTIYTSNDTLITLVAEFQHEVSVEGIKGKNIKIYPNPAHTEIYIQADTPTILRLYDIFGREIKDCHENKLSISELKKGLYFLRVFDKNGNLLKTEKLIKE
jgi:hypothetical protein